MFDGFPVEHYMISTPSSRNPPDSSLIQTPPILTTTSLNFLSFDPLLFHPLHSHHHQALFQPNDHDRYNDTQGIVDQENDLGLDISESWSNDEVIQLLRIKSGSENWFKDLSWDHVSRKLAEMGYKRSSEECKEKFEEETCRSFSSDIGYNKRSSRYLIHENPDEHLCNQKATIQSADQTVNHQEQPQLQEKGGDQQDVESSGQKGQFEKDPIDEVMAVQATEAQVAKSNKKRKRKHKKFKMVKGLCVELVNKMMAQQEEMQKQVLEDMAKLDEEKMKREEAWRKEELDRVEMEIQVMEHEQELARDRQSTITEYLTKLTSFSKIPFDMNLEADATKLMSRSATTKISSSSNPSYRDQPIAHETDEITGKKRWPRDEVLALINIRIRSNGNNTGRACRGSLWERISEGMLELGYKRSAKRCKEKWENINKYFRRTKDANNKRCLESTTCPYYHELTKLYNLQSLSNSQEQLPTKLASKS